MLALVLVGVCLDLEGFQPPVPSRKKTTYGLLVVLVCEDAELIFPPQLGGKIDSLCGLRSTSVGALVQFKGDCHVWFVRGSGYAPFRSRLPVLLLTGRRGSKKV